MKTQRWMNRIKRRLQFNLSTLLLLLTLCACGIACWNTNTKQKMLVTQLNSFLSLSGLVPITDVTRYHSLAKSATSQELNLWVPRGSRLNLCWATHFVDDVMPQDGESVVLTEGRHSVSILTSAKETSLVVDHQTVFERQRSSQWNIQAPICWTHTGDLTLISPTTQISRSHGVATLAADEPYDAKRHSFGLVVWVEIAQ